MHEHETGPLLHNFNKFRKEKPESWVDFPRWVVDAVGCEGPPAHLTRLRPSATLIVARWERASQASGSSGFFAVRWLLRVLR